MDQGAGALREEALAHAMQRPQIELFRRRR
jgi:hypothetical protein